MTNEKNTWGGKRPGSGRKEGAIIDPEQKKTHRIVVMCTKEQCDRFTLNAKDEGLTAGSQRLYVQILHCVQDDNESESLSS